MIISANRINSFTKAKGSSNYFQDLIKLEYFHEYNCMQVVVLESIFESFWEKKGYIAFWAVFCSTKDLQKIPLEN